MRAILHNEIIAEAPKEALIYIEGNWYFPPDHVKTNFLKKSDTPYVCPWKGVCQYFDVGKNEAWRKDAAWSYPEPKDSAIAQVKKDFSNYIAFWRDVQVSE